jgi:hypothetical protein
LSRKWPPDDETNNAVTPLPHRGAQLSEIDILPVRDVAMSNHHHAAICDSAGRKNRIEHAAPPGAP